MGHGSEPVSSASKPGTPHEDALLLSGLPSCNERLRHSGAVRVSLVPTGGQS
jgi:hypothetical protein